MHRRVFILACGMLMSGQMAFADVPTKTPFPAVSWTSKNQNDIITVQNGSDNAVIVAITVTAAANQTAGINVNNCGTITHINAGSSVLCTSDDATHPVNFSSDSPGTPVSGTYQIKPQTD